VQGIRLDQHALKIQFTQQLLEHGLGFYTTRRDAAVCEILHREGYRSACEYAYIVAYKVALCSLLGLIEDSINTAASYFTGFSTCCLQLDAKFN